MNTLISFITNLSWVALVLCSFLIIFKIYCQMTYEGSVWETIDSLKGLKRTWNGSKELIIIIASIAWLLAV